MENKVTIVAGMGEVGRPLHTILSKVYDCVGIDVAPAEVNRPCEVLHICYPFQIRDFVGTTVSYVEKYRPELVVINSTVSVGTTRKVQERVSCPIVYSPVRGKHVKMEQELVRYKKFIGGSDPASMDHAKRHFEGAGMKVGIFRNSETAEVSKLLETTWLGILVGWAQEIERMAEQCGASYEEVNLFIEEIDFLPSNVFPGHIGGHCVMPNIAILRERFRSKMLDAVVESNEAKGKNRKLPPAAEKLEAAETEDDDVRMVR